MADHTPKLDTPHIRVTLTDGQSWELQTINSDMVMFDLERAKRKWPAMQDAPFLWLSYLAYSALRRDGAVNGVQFDNWVLTTQSIDNLNETGQPDSQVAGAFPTQLEAAPDSLSNWQ